jgi:hypothetical protein
MALGLQTAPPPQASLQSQQSEETQMNWSIKPAPKEGDLRVRTAFLFLPLTIGKQVKWGERACWVELHQRGAYGALEWRPLSWREPINVSADGKGWRSIFSKPKTDKITL